MSQARIPRPSPPIYVETHINDTVDEVWDHTQSPEIHQRWDLRFSKITYLQAIDGEPQRFVYSTAIAPGLAVDGREATLGERHRRDGTAYSGLKFWSDHPISLIKEGARYWRYVPRRRVKHGITPERSRNQTLVHFISVLTLAFAWTYQGIIPKVLYPGASELDLLKSTGGGLGHARIRRNHFRFRHPAVVAPCLPSQSGLSVATKPHSSGPSIPSHSILDSWV